jgi:hypothetical protein
MRAIALAQQYAKAVPIADIWGQDTPDQTLTSNQSVAEASISSHDWDFFHSHLGKRNFQELSFVVGVYPHKPQNTDHAERPMVIDRGCVTAKPPTE